MEVKKCILLHKVDWIQDKVKHNLILFHHKVENFLQANPQASRMDKEGQFRVLL